MSMATYSEQMRNGRWVDGVDSVGCLLCLNKVITKNDDEMYYSSNPRL